MAKITELKTILSKVKNAQAQLQNILQDKTWVEEARKYADKQGKEVRKLLATDAGKVRAFIEKERKELEKFQKQIPTEVKKFKKFVSGQRKELDKLLRRVNGNRKPRAKSSTRGTTKKSGAKKDTSAQA